LLSIAKAILLKKNWNWTRKRRDVPSKQAYTGRKKGLRNKPKNLSGKGLLGEVPQRRNIWPTRDLTTANETRGPISTPTGSHKNNLGRGKKKRKEGAAKIRNFTQREGKANPSKINNTPPSWTCLFQATKELKKKSLTIRGGARGRKEGA